MSTNPTQDPVEAAMERKQEELELLRKAAKIAPNHGFKLVLAAESGHVVVTGSNAETPRRTGFTAAVREVYAKYLNTFTIHTVANDLKASHPEFAQGENLMVNISAILGRAAKGDGLMLVTQGAAGQPSVYRNIGRPRSLPDDEVVRDEEER